MFSQTPLPRVAPNPLTAVMAAAADSNWPVSGALPSVFWNLSEELRPVPTLAGACLQPISD